MSRSLFIVLAVLALLSTVSAQMSSSSSYMAPASSTGASSSASASGASSATGVINPINPTGAMSSSSSAFPANTYSVFFTVDFAYPITTENINATAQSVQGDIIYNLATLSNEGNSSLIGNVFVTNINGTAVSGAPMARRLLQASTYASGVTYIILGSIQGVSPATLVQQFSNAAANGQLVTVYTTNATIPKQTVSVAAISAVSSSSTGLGSTGGASSAASASIALLFAAVASMALLL